MPLRVGIAHHYGWAIAVTANDEHEVVDRRRIELLEDGLPPAPVHHEGGPHAMHRAGEPLDDGALAALVADVRASAVRATSASLGALPDGIVSLSVRAWPSEMPADIGVLRRPPWEAKVDSFMYCQVLAEAAAARGWDVHLYDAKRAESEAKRFEGLHGPPWTKDHRIALAAVTLAP